LDCEHERNGQQRQIQNLSTLDESIFAAAAHRFTLIESARYGRVREQTTAAHPVIRIDDVSLTRAHNVTGLFNFLIPKK
jgi:hypothetical protein